MRCRLTPSPRTRRGAPQQPEEERPADQGGEHADRQVGVRHRGARDEVGDSQQQRAAEDARGEQEQRCAGPMTMRIRCGTTSPTKAMMPANATAAPTSSATSTIATIRSRSTFTPRCRAAALAEREQVEPCATASARRRAPTDDERQRRPRTCSPADAVEAAELPEHDLLARLRVAEERSGSARPAPVNALTAMPVSTSVTTSVRAARRGDSA